MIAPVEDDASDRDGCQAEEDDEDHNDPFPVVGYPKRRSVSSAQRQGKGAESGFERRARSKGSLGKRGRKGSK